MSALLNEEWQDKAACRGPHVDLFFPPVITERREEKRVRELKAKSICAQCAVTDDCLSHALEVGEHHGVWGGTNEIERRHMLAQLELDQAGA